MKKFLLMGVVGATLISTAGVAQGLGGGMQRDQTRAEAQQRADRMFQMLDVNHDGVVTRAEAEQVAAQFEAQRNAENGQGTNRMARMLDRAFGTSQSLTLQQFEAQALARFDAQDLNHDGVVTVAERQQLREQRAQRQQLREQRAQRQPMGSQAPAAAVPPAPQPHQ